MANPLIDFVGYYLACQNDLVIKYQTKSTTNFFTKHNVETKQAQKGNLSFTKFKYEDNCKFSYLWQIASRGTIFIKNKDRLTKIFSLNKFFNSHEFERIYPVTFEQFILSLENQGFKFVFMPKYDGSYVQCFTDEAGTKHRHTLGSLEQNKIGKSLITYNFATNKLLNNNFPKLYDFLDANPGFSLVCEIITPNNKIKTVYDFTENMDGTLKPLVLIDPNGIPTFDGIKEYIFNGHWNKWEFTTANLNEIKNLAMTEIESNAAEFGIHPEGLVVYCYKDNICFPIAKMKRPEYLNFDETEELEIECKIDDIVLTESQQTHIDKFTTYLNKAATLFENLELVINMSNLSQKQYANLVAEIPRDLQSYSNLLFRLRKDGFVFVSGYDTVIKLLNLEIIENSERVKSIRIFQLKYGPNWFEKI